MTSRPVVSYDDITLPYDTPAKPTNSQPPSKKRRRNNHKKQAQHWVGSTPSQVLDEDGPLEDEESRELTHEEIWDDSALIDAWDAAMEEYEAYHGPEKGWKTEPVHKSPLWYNIPPKNLPLKKSKLAVVTPEVDQPDSKPIDFDTFVPTHDASLSAAVEDDTSQVLYDVPLTYQPDVSQDEAFQRAVQASYWSGYWTAIYHCHRQAQSKQLESIEAEVEQDISSSISSSDEDEEFVSTQR